MPLAMTSGRNIDLNVEHSDVFLMLRYHLASISQLVEHLSEQVPGLGPGRGNDFCSFLRPPRGKEVLLY